MVKTATLKATFELIDRMSSQLDSIARSGGDAVEQWERAGSAANSAFGAAERGAARAATACSGVATSAGGASDAANSLEDMFVVCEQAAASLTDAMAATTSIQEELEEAMREAGGASEEAEEALRELEAAQQEARDAMENYDAVLTSGTDDLGELEAAAERAMHAAEDLAAANEKATQATEALGRQSEETGEEVEDTGQKGVKAFEAIGNTLIGAGIAKTLKEAAEAAYELADAFSEAESTVVLATGATGEALDSLTGSMMRVYAASRTGSLSDTAAAVGEINTRLGQTGAELEETTGLFLDFAAVTGGQAASSVRNVTQLMSRWNIGAGELESTLDKLTYAGQASGISVDSLSSELTANKAILDQLGFSLDESIAMFAQFELNGISATSAITGLRTALTNGTISSLEDLYGVFEKISKGELDVAGAADIFGRKAATEIVDAVNNGAFALDDMVEALENTAGTTVRTAETAQTLGQKWEQASNNIGAAFSSQIEPVTGRISSGLADVANKVGTFLNQHPAVTRALTAGAVAIGVVAAGIAAVTFSTTVAIPAIKAFGVAVNAALGPIGWIALGITAAVAACTALVAMMDSAEDVTYSMTASTREQYYAVQELNEEYDEAIATYGATSEEALRLKYQLEDLNASFEANRQTVEEFVAECDALIESSAKLTQGYSEHMTSINQQEIGTLSLIQKLEDLASTNERTASTEEQMKALIDQLNSELPGLSLNYEDVASGATAWADAMVAAAEAQADQERQVERQQTYVELLKEQGKLEDEIAKAEANLNAERKAHGYYFEEATHMWTNGVAYEGSLLANWTTDIDIYNDKLKDLNATYESNMALLEEIKGEWDAQVEAMLAAQDASKSYEEAVSTALTSVQNDIDELCSAYDKAFESARNSIDGQIGLFDTMKTETELSVQDMQAAFASQIEYLALYTENLRKAAEYGIDEGLIESLSDGSEESAGYINAIIENIEALGAGSENARVFVNDFNSAFQEVEQAKDEFATTVAKMELDFDEKMEKIEERLADSIEKMNKEGDAAAAAAATIEAYTQAIRDGESAAVAAAASVSAGVAAALKTTGTTGVTVGVSGHASGTTEAEDVFVAGENGPELILDRGGSTVFPADETRKIVNAVENQREQYRPPEYYAGGAPDDGGESKESGSSGESVKRIVLELAGIGSIELTGAGGASREDIADVLVENLKPALVQIIADEMFEEGDGSYEY